MNPESILASYLSVCAYVNQIPRGLGDAQLLAVPPGLHNNIVWNLGHLIVDNSDMLYRPAGLEPPHPSSMTSLFDAGTSPADWNEPPVVADILDRSGAFANRVATDFRTGAFQDFDPGLVVSGWPVANLQETLAYVTNHTAIHLGVLMTLRRLVS